MNTKSFGVLLVLVLLGAAVGAIGDFNIAIGAAIGMALGAGIVGTMNKSEGNEQ